jgi:hypothetical protein
MLLPPTPRELFFAVRPTVANEIFCSPLKENLQRPASCRPKSEIIGQKREVAVRK